MSVGGTRVQAAWTKVDEAMDILATARTWPGLDDAQRGSLAEATAALTEASKELAAIRRQQTAGFTE